MLIATDGTLLLDPDKLDQKLRKRGPDVGTRKVLYLDYMNVLAKDLVVDKTEFLGQGVDPGGKADYQGCSEFNPVLVFSQGRSAAVSGPRQ